MKYLIYYIFLIIFYSTLISAKEIALECTCDQQKITVRPNKDDVTNIKSLVVEECTKQIISLEIDLINKKINGEVPYDGFFANSSYVHWSYANLQNNNSRIRYVLNRYTGKYQTISEHIPLDEISTNESKTIFDGIITNEDPEKHFYFYKTTVINSYTCEKAEKLF